MEDLHAGEWSELLENEKLSRITDEEMKALMIKACEQVAKLLHLKESDPSAYYLFIMEYNLRYCRHWQR